MLQGWMMGPFLIYAGLLNADLTQIDGIWTTEDGGRLTGGFRMLRGSGGPKAAVTRAAREPIFAEAQKERKKVAVVPGSRKPKKK